MPANSKTHISQINFTNAWPIFHYFPSDEVQAEITFLNKVPTELNKAMASGKVDIGAISAFAYGKNVDQYDLLPNLSVSAYGSVNSILLFYRKSWEEVLNGTIALPTTSATSVNLLKIIVQKFYGANPQYVYCEPNLPGMMKVADGGLLIGDDAIRASWESAGYHVIDLGSEWHRWTNEWMTYAVWVVRKPFAKRHSQTVERIYQAFQASKMKGRQHPEPIIHAACKQVGGEQVFWRHYFSQLYYDFGSDQRRGLELYFHYAYELGLLNKPVVLNMWYNNMYV